MSLGEIISSDVTKHVCQQKGWSSIATVARPSGLLTQKLLAASNGELYTAM